MDMAELIENFSFLTDWEDRYAYLIELGKDLPPMKPEDKNDRTKVEGCMSQVWLKTEINNDVLSFVGESDAHIVRGLIAVLRIILSGKGSVCLSIFPSVKLSSLPTAIISKPFSTRKAEIIAGAQVIPIRIRVRVLTADIQNKLFKVVFEECS